MKPLYLSTAALLAFAGAASLAHAQPDGKRWIQGSWVNVRASNAADSAVVDHLTTNSAVTLRADNGKSCEISWSLDGRDGRGFVPCRLLGERPLTFAEVNNELLLDGKENPQRSPLRAFWIEPSMAHLFAAGEHFAKTLLSPEQYDLEHGGGENPSSTAPRLVRYPVPEFDAMKSVLAKGIVAPGGGNPWSRSCDEILAQPAKPAPGADQADSEAWRYAEPACRLPTLALRLPSARPSLFKSSERLLPGGAGIEDIGAGFGIVERGKTLSGPKWQSNRDGWRYTGAWDIGKYELTLDKPVVEHVVGRTGLIGAYGWTPQVRITPNTMEDCAEGLLAERRGKQALPGYPVVKDALMWFQAPQALPFKTAKIKARVERAPASDKESLAIKRVAVYEIDLDGDGVPDFVEWDVWAVPQISGDGGPTVIKRETYVNVGGRWYPFGHDTYGECT